MAKGRFLNKSKKRIKNAHLIGKGGKHIKPIKGSWVKGYHKAMAKPRLKTKKVTTPLKSKMGFIPKKNTFKRKISAAKPSPIKRMNPNIKRVVRKSTPSPTMTMKSRKPARKPPSIGR